MQQMVSFKGGVPGNSGKFIAKGLQMAIKMLPPQSNKSDYLQILKVKQNMPKDQVIGNNAADDPKFPIVYLDKDVKNFSRLANKEFKIPRIIHQTWINYDIPAKFVQMVKTWHKVNPDWEYWFWTDKDAEKFIKMKYPRYYDMYKRYPQNIHRADAMRYFILHEFGGLYADMDVEALKPLDDLAHQHHCIIAQEPWPHTVIYWHKTRLACNALMAARPKHPFFNLVLEHLPSNAARGGKGEVMDKTGPKMIDRLVTEYEKLKKKNFMSSETLYLGNPNSFLPTIAGNVLRLVKIKCKSKQSNALAQKICDQLKRENFANKIPAEAITDHKWVHTYYGIDKKKSENIFKLVPHAKNVQEMLEKMAKKAGNL
jgi:mannosyltransferase OCH1-like enzyme